MKTFICKITGKEYQAIFSKGFHPDLDRETIINYELDQAAAKGELHYIYPQLSTEMIIERRRLAEQERRNQENAKFEAKRASYQNEISRKVFGEEKLTADDLANLTEHLDTSKWMDFDGEQVGADTWKKHNKNRIYFNLREGGRGRKPKVSGLGYIDLDNGDYVTERRISNERLADVIQVLWK